MHFYKSKIIDLLSAVNLDRSIQYHPYLARANSCEGTYIYTLETSLPEGQVPLQNLNPLMDWNRIILK